MRPAPPALGGVREEGQRTLGRPSLPQGCCPPPVPLLPLGWPGGGRPPAPPCLLYSTSLTFSLQMKLNYNKQPQSISPELKQQALGDTYPAPWLSKSPGQRHHSALLSPPIARTVGLGNRGGGWGAGRLGCQVHKMPLWKQSPRD